IATTKDSIIEVFGLKTDTRVIGWIHHKLNYWYRLPHAAGAAPAYLNEVAHITDLPASPLNVPPLTNDSVIIFAMAHGVYKLEFYITYPQYENDSSLPGREDGGVIPSFTDTILADCNGVLKFRIPVLPPIPKNSTIHAPHYGFKLTWLSPVTTTDI